MAALCASGVRPAEAALLARSGETSVRAATIEDLTQRLLRGVMAFDERALRDTLDVAFAHRLPAQIHDEIISPALVRVGELWASSALPVAHEHLFTSLVRERLAARLREILPGPSAPSAILACADEDQHDVGLLGFALHVASWGLRPIILGGRVPPAALAATLHTRPRFVGVSFVAKVPPARAKALIAAYRSVLRGQRWVVGGYAVSSVSELATASGAIVVPAMSDAPRLILA